MGTIVTGLLQTSDTTKVRTALASAGLSLEHLQVIEPDDSSQGVARNLTGTSDLLTGDIGSGTGVPGLTSGGGLSAGIGGSVFFRNEDIADRLADIRIPDSQMDNYVEALERGKTIVAFFAKPDTVEAATAAFKGAELANVRVF
jgi:hypothetical protein